MRANYAALALSAFFFGLLERFPPFGSSWTWFTLRDCSILTRRMVLPNERVMFR